MMRTHFMRTVEMKPLGLTLVVFLSLATGTKAASPPITALAMAPGKSELLAGSQNGVQRFSWPDLKPGDTLKSGIPQIHDLAFSPDGTLLAIAGGTPGVSGNLELWTWPGRQKLRANDLHSDVIYQLVWTANSKRICTASHDGGVFDFDPHSGKIIRQFLGHSEPVRALCLLEHQQTLLSAGNDQTIRVWDTKTGRLQRLLHNHTKAVYAIAQKPTANASDVPVVASVGADGTVRLWQPTIGRMMRFRRLTSSVPLAMAWSSDGEALFITDDRGKLHTIDHKTLEIRATLDTKTACPLCLLLSPDGKTAVVGGMDSSLQKISLGN